MYNSSFPMCFKLPKDTNLKCAKICQKIRKSLPWQQCFIKSPSEELRSVCLNAYPRQMESKTSKEGLPSTQQFLTASFRLKQDAS